MRTAVEFVLVALVLVVTPGPATATVLRRVEQGTGAVMVALGLRLGREAR